MRLNSPAVCARSSDICPANYTLPFLKSQTAEIGGLRREEQGGGGERARNYLSGAQHIARSVYATTECSYAATHNRGERLMFATQRDANSENNRCATHVLRIVDLIIAPRNARLRRAG